MKDSQSMIPRTVQNSTMLQKPKKIETLKEVPRLGLMMVGLGGNNGSTVTAGILANKMGIEWETKNGMQKSNFYGSFTQCATAHCGFVYDEKTGNLQDKFKAIKDIVPLVKPTDMIISGWDISSENVYMACKRAKVLEPALLKQMEPELSAIKPLPAIFNQEYIASNQADRVNNIIKGDNRECINIIRKDIQDMKKRTDSVVVMWTANTEAFLLPEIMSEELLLKKIDENADLPASVLYCVACIEEKVVYLNGSPQNTFHKGVVDYCRTKGSFIAGSDFKSGQTRFKTIMSDFLIGSGLKLNSVVSYNHLGNNDGKNLQEDKCFQSKKISKAGVIDDAIKNNNILYEKKEKIDHEVVIKYIPFVGDSKRAMDEYSSTIFMNGINTISSYNVCEDSLLASPIIIDIVLLAELFTRMKINDKPLGPVMSYLSFFFKAPVTNHDEYVINSFSRQREMLVNLLKAGAGICPDDATLLNFKF